MAALHFHRSLQAAPAELPLHVLSTTRTRCLAQILCLHQRRVTSCFCETEGKSLLEWKKGKIYATEFSWKGSFYPSHMSWSCVISLLKSRINKLEAQNEGSSLDKQALTMLIKVVTGLLGMAFLVAKMGCMNARIAAIQAQAFSLWFFGTPKICELQATPLNTGQFGAITLAFNSASSVFNLPVISLAFIQKSIPRFSYILDILLERQPLTYTLLLMIACVLLVFVGGILFSTFRSYQQKRGDSFWDAWACLCSSSTHLKEKTSLERCIGLILAVGGLLFYSLLTSTMTAHFKSRMEWLREGAHSEVMEHGHVVICGMNNHLTTVLKQLNKSKWLALREGQTNSLKQTVLLLSENERKVTEKLISNEVKTLPQLNILTRSGSLTNTASFEKVGADKAQSIIVLATNKDKYEADAESILTVLALQPLLDSTNGKLIVEVFNASTSELLRSSTGLTLHTVQNLSSKLLVQCSRQPGLVEIYQELLEHDRQIINIRSFSSLAGITYQALRRGSPKAVVCGLLRDGKIDFHPPDQLLLSASDKVLMICAKDCYKDARRNLISSNKKDDLSVDPVFDKQDRLVAQASSIQSTPKQPSKAAQWQAGPKERILVLGWHPRVAEMILEYDEYVGPESELIILAETSKEEREHILHRKTRNPLRNVRVNHQVGNPKSRTDIRSALLHPLPTTSRSRCSFRKSKAPDNTNMPLSILVIGDTTWNIEEDKPRPDKQSVLALLLAEDVCKKLELEVNSLVAEFMDPELGKQVMNLRPNLKAISTDELIGLVTAQVAEQGELADVWADLLNAKGDEIYMKDISQYIKEGEHVTFEMLAERAVIRNEVAIGYKMGDQTVINPPSKDAPLNFTKKDVLVVISEFQYST